MIEIKVNTKRNKIEIRGHAMPEESTEYGLICSAVSAVAQSCAYALSKRTGQGEIKAVDYKDRPGDYRLKVFPEGEIGTAVVQTIISVYSDGLELLAASHPEAVTMIRDNRRIEAEEVKAV